MTTTTKETFAEQVAELYKQCNQENYERMKVRDTEPYLQLEAEICDVQEEIAILQDQIAQRKEAMKMLESTIEDSTSEYEDAKRKLMDIMRAEGFDSIGCIKAKYSKGNYVSGNALLTAIGGDMDAFMSIASITQKAVKDYAKEIHDPKVKKAILGSIHEKEPVLDDIVVEIPEA